MKKKKTKLEHFSKDSFSIVVKHFADDIGVNVIFKKGATPHITPERAVVLPEEMYFANAEDVAITLWHLLHECRHITDTKEPEVSLNSPERLCLNVLEDLRIDDITFKHYPHTKDFLEMAVEEVVEEFKKSKPETPEEIKRTETLARLLSFLMNYQGIEHLYKNKGVKKFWRKHRKAREEIYEDVRGSKRTYKLADSAKRLAKILFEGGEWQQQRPELKYSWRGFSSDKAQNALRKMSKMFTMEGRFGTKPAETKKQEFEIKTLSDNTIERELLKLLRSTHQREVQRDEGRILPQNLPFYYDDERLFVDEVTITEEMSQLSFVIDCSGSMKGTPAEVAGNSLLNILDVLNKFIIREGMVEFNVLTFASSGYGKWLKKFGDRYSRDDIYNGYQDAFRTLGGGTDIIPATAEALGKFKADARRKILFLITDGTLEERDYKWLDKNIPDDVMLVFLRIGGSEDNLDWIRGQKMDELWKKFYNFSVESIEDLGYILKDQITKALKGE